MVAGSLLISCAGCGGADSHPVAPVKGKVMFEGKEVTQGSISFTPIGGEKEKKGPGKPAESEIASDGTYALSTHGNKDGAVVGKHRVSFSPPPGPSFANSEEYAKAKAKGLDKAPYEGLVPKTPEVEVKSGSNEINIELVKGS
jgi:hypothetical protein